MGEAETQAELRRQRERATPKGPAVTIRSKGAGGKRQKRREGGA